MQQPYTSDLTASHGAARAVARYRKTYFGQTKKRLAPSANVEAIFYVTKNGVVWRDLPVGFPAWQTVYWYFRKWAKDDTWLLIANERGRPRGDILHRIKVDKKPLPTVAIIDSQSVKNSATATEQIGFDGGKLIKGRKRFLIVDTMGHLLWTDVRPANVADGKAGVLLWEQAEHLNPLLDDLVLMYADSTFGGHFKEQLETIYDMRVVIPRTPIKEQPVDSKLVIHHWRWIVERTISWLGNNRRLSKDYERTVLSAQTFIWIAHIRRTMRQVWQ